MAAKAGARIKITLRCSECKQRNYNTFKNKKNTPDRLELNNHGFRSGAGTKAFPPAAAKGNKTGRTGKEPETAKAAGTVRRIG